MQLVCITTNFRSQYGCNKDSIDVVIKVVAYLLML